MNPEEIVSEAHRLCLAGGWHGIRVDAGCWKAVGPVVEGRYAYAYADALTEQGRTDVLEALETWRRQFERILDRAEAGLPVQFGISSPGPWTRRIQTHHQNVQGIPREARAGIVAHEGRKFLVADAGASQLRLVAALSQDPQLLADCAVDVDPYTALGAMIAPGWPFQRDAGKLLALSVLFGVGAKTLAIKVRELEQGQPVPFPYSENRAETAIAALWARYPVLFAWRKAWGLRRSFLSPLGLPITAPAKPGDRRGIPLHRIFAGAVQCAEADALRTGIVAASLRNPGLRLLVPMHDGGLWDAPEWGAESAADELREVLTAAWASIPVSPGPININVAVRDTWGD